jgi:hypothetical protein
VIDDGNFTPYVDRSSDEEIYEFDDEFDDAEHGMEVSLTNLMIQTHGLKKTEVISYF